MKTGQLELLRLFIHNDNNNVFKLLELYDISKRTLYYDLEEINNFIFKYGQIKITENRINFDGDLLSLSQNLESELLKPYYKSQERQNFILLSILNEESNTLEEFSEQFQVSKTTIFSDVEAIRSELAQEDVKLLYKNKYFLMGNEWGIRDLYLSLLTLKPFSYDQIRNDVKEFNAEKNLLLSDYSLFYLSNFIKFIESRINRGCFLNSDYVDRFKQVEFAFDWNLNKYLKTDNELEIIYLKAYIVSLSGMKKSKTTTLINDYVNTLLTKIEHKFALSIKWSNSFKRSLQNHLLSSYYRIEFSFPALNPSLNDIKMNYFSLFHGLKQIIRETSEFGELYKMRDEEIGFVTAYIGGYLLRNKDFPLRKKKLVIVCPQGRAVSNNLKHQISSFLEDVEIVGNYSIDQIGTMSKDYDFIVSTVELPHLYNVIKVNPILSQLDKQNLVEMISPAKKFEVKDFDAIYSIIKKNTKIVDKDNLIKQLKGFLLESENNWRYEPMLKDLLTENRIQKLKSVKDWKHAIEIASKPLLDDGSIRESYIEAMIASVEKFGPYIVLADEFALPHASSEGGVNKLSMSMLIVDDRVDLLGKDVKIFLVLASVDNKSHLKALASLTDILSAEDNLEFIKTASIKDIIKLIEDKEVNK